MRVRVAIWECLIILVDQKSKSFLFFINRVWKKAHGWKDKFLSKGGKEILIKYVLQYDFENYSSIWWKGGSGQGINWISWKRLCLKKKDGGLGFKDLRIFNQALLAKQRWRILQFSDTLAARVLKAKYFPSSNFLHEKVESQPSFLWRSLLKGRELLNLRLRWRIGNGEQVRVFQDPWLANSLSFRPGTRLLFMSNQLRVSDIIQNGRWNVELIQVIFDDGDREQILAYPP